jgi:hypothetical protein
MLPLAMYETYQVIFDVSGIGYRSIDGVMAFWVGQGDVPTGKMVLLKTISNPRSCEGALPSDPVLTIAQPH